MDIPSSGDGEVGQRVFPPTHYSLVRAVESADPGVRERALDGLIAAYWRPVYSYLRLHWRIPHEDAKDLTQDFFTLVIEGRTLKAYRPDRAKFRTYLRVCLDGFVSNAQKAATRLKRGGEARFISLDFIGEEAELESRATTDHGNAEELFRQEWARSMFALAVEALNRECAASGHETHFALFERYDLLDHGRPTYTELAKQAGLTSTQVTNYLAYARRQFRSILLEKVRELSGSESEFREEARELLGQAAR
jgi:RNA polymerase sigma factor (sigma-70 family)